MSGETYENDRVSIVIPSYNNASYIAKTVESVINQDYRNIELIIIDDGSSDNSVTIIESLRERCQSRFPRFEFRYRNNRGLSATLNEALSWMSGRFVAVLDSDDMMFPNKTRVLVSHLADANDLVGVFGGAKIVDSEDRIIDDKVFPDRTYSFRDILFRDKHLTSSAGLWRLDAVRQVGGYVNGMYIEDWYMWLRLTEQGKMLKRISLPLILYRQHANNMSGNALKMLESRKEILDIFKDHAGHERRISRIYLEASIGFSSYSKFASWKYLIRALRAHAQICDELYFWRVFVRILTPRHALEFFRYCRRSVRQYLPRKRSQVLKK